MEPKGTFGPRLRQERERRQISLTSIAANTKISRSLLEALERDDVARWPSGIFRRSFIRSYAKAIGLDPNDVAKEFLERFPDPSNPPAPPEEPAQPADPPIVARLIHHSPKKSVASVEAREPQAEGRLAKGDRVELVFRVSVPRSLANWALWVKSLAARVHPIPRRQNM